MHWLTSPTQNEKESSFNGLRYLTASMDGCKKCETIEKWHEFYKINCLLVSYLKICMLHYCFGNMFSFTNNWCKQKFLNTGYPYALNRRKKGGSFFLYQTFFDVGAWPTKNCAGKLKIPSRRRRLSYSISFPSPENWTSSQTKQCHNYKRCSQFMNLILNRKKGFSTF